jgi:hypothetical protein
MVRIKRTSNELQNTTHKNKDYATRIQLKIGDEVRCSGRVGNDISILMFNCSDQSAPPIIQDLSSICFLLIQLVKIRHLTNDC